MQLFQKSFSCVLGKYPTLPIIQGSSKQQLLLSCPIASKQDPLGQLSFPLTNIITGTPISKNPQSSDILMFCFRETSQTSFSGRRVSLLKRARAAEIKVSGGAKWSSSKSESVVKSASRQGQGGGEWAQKLQTASRRQCPEEQLQFWKTSGTLRSEISPVGQVRYRRVLVRRISTSPLQMKGRPNSFEWRGWKPKLATAATSPSRINQFMPIVQICLTHIPNTSQPQTIEMQR